MSPLAPLEDGLLLSVRLTPGARRAAVEGVVARDDGRLLLKVKVSEPPEDGRANAALLALLAKALGKPKRDLALVAGARQREKTVKLSGEPKALEREVAAWIARLSHRGERAKGAGRA